MDRQSQHTDNHFEKKNETKSTECVLYLNSNIQVDDKEDQTIGHTYSLLHILLIVGFLFVIVILGVIILFKVVQAVNTGDIIVRESFHAQKQQYLTSR